MGLRGFRALLGGGRGGMTYNAAMKRSSAYTLMAAVLLAAPARGFSAPLDTEMACLARAVWWESRGEPQRGQRAVLDVILNRMDAANSTACAVVGARRQFSWWPSKGASPVTSKMWHALADALSHPPVISDPNVVFFSRGIPKWMHSPSCSKIGAHYFCKSAK